MPCKGGRSSCEDRCPPLPCPSGTSPGAEFGATSILDPSGPFPRSPGSCGCAPVPVPCGTWTFLPWAVPEELSRGGVGRGMCGAFSVPMHNPCPHKHAPARPCRCTDRASTALSLRCHCGLELGMHILLLICPQRRWAVGAGSSVAWGGGCVPVLGWLMHGKGKISRASGGSEPAPACPRTQGEAAGCRSSPNPSPQHSCSNTLCFSFTLFTHCPGFHWAESFIYLNRQAMDLHSCS